MNEVKLIVAGPMGAGKTTAIRAISEIEPISTEVRNTNQDECAKENTTVALDYGEVRLDTGELLRLYGTPGQARFDFMWELLGRDALGVLVLMDNSRRDPLADLAAYLQAFPALVNAGRVVVVIGRLESHPQPSLEDYLDRLDGLGVSVPVMPADVRNRDDVLMALDLLFQHIDLFAADDGVADDWSRLVATARTSE